MKDKIILYFSLTIFLISATILTSCKSSFPPAGTMVECNGKLLQPIQNPSQKASYPGGSEAMFQFLKDNFKLPPEIANEDINGKIRVAFIITKEGETCDVRITSKPIKYLDEEFVRIFKMMPKWIPAKNGGENVDSYYLLDINV